MCRAQNLIECKHARLMRLSIEQSRGLHPTMRNLIWSEFSQTKVHSRVAKSPSFLAAFHRRTFGRSHSEFWEYTEFSEAEKCSVKNGCTRKYIFFLNLYHVGHFNVEFKCPYTRPYIATLFRSPIYALHGLAVHAIQCKVVLFVFELVC